MESTQGRAHERAAPSTVTPRAATNEARQKATASSGEGADDVMTTVTDIPTTTVGSGHGARSRRRTETAERVGVSGLTSAPAATDGGAAAAGDALEPAAYGHVAEPDDDEAAVAGVEEDVLPEAATALKAARGEVSALDVARPAKAPLTQTRRPSRLRRWELADQALSIPVHNADLGLLGELVALVPATFFQPFSVPLLLCAAYFLAHERFFAEALAGTCVARAACGRAGWGG